MLINKQVKDLNVHETRAICEKMKKCTQCPMHVDNPFIDNCVMRLVNTMGPELVELLNKHIEIEVNDGDLFKE